MAALSGIYWFVAAIGCYQTLFLQNIGFTATNIGILNALCSVIGIGAMSFWASTQTAKTPCVTRRSCC